jgi:hypothetical protein
MAYGRVKTTWDSTPVEAKLDGRGLLGDAEADLVALDVGVQLLVLEEICRVLLEVDGRPLGIDDLVALTGFGSEGDLQAGLAIVLRLGVDTQSGSLDVCGLDYALDCCGCIRGDREHDRPTPWVACRTNCCPYPTNVEANVLLGLLETSCTQDVGMVLSERSTADGER